MTDENDTTTKLIVLVAGLSTIVFFAYLVYKDHNKSILPTLSLSQQKPTELERIEQRLLQLETKIDSLSTNQKPAQPQERTIVSMSKPKQQVNAITKMRNSNTKEMFGMR